MLKETPYWIGLGTPNPQTPKTLEVWIRDIKRGSASNQREGYMQAAKIMLGGGAPPATEDDRERAASGYYSINKA